MLCRKNEMREDTKVVVDDTTIYEIDLNCYDCLSEQERRKYFPQVWRMGKPVWNMGRDEPGNSTRSRVE